MDLIIHAVLVWVCHRHDRCLLAAMIALSASLRRKDIMRSGLCPPVRFASGVTWENSVQEGGRGDVGKDPGLGAKIVPLLCAHAQGFRFTESWHAFEGARDEFHDIGCECV